MSNLMKHSVNDAWHKGNYKQYHNAAEAIEGSKQNLIPVKFPDLMTAALGKQDISIWAAREELVLKK